MDSKKELEEYIIDSGDIIQIEFLTTEELNNNFKVNPEGEIILPRLEETYVRGLTTNELEILLKKKYQSFINNPEIRIRLIGFKPIRILIAGEVRNPGIYDFPFYTNRSSISLEKSQRTDLNNEVEIRNNDKFLENIDLNSRKNNLSTISTAIKSANGITSLTDLSNIEVARKIPIGKGGGFRKLRININSFLDTGFSRNDIRIFDGDKIFIPKLKKANNSQIPKSVLTGLSPRFITINVFGLIENPGRIKVPLESSLSDVLALSGPKKHFQEKLF